MSEKVWNLDELNGVLMGVHVEECLCICVSYLGFAAPLPLTGPVEACCAADASPVDGRLASWSECSGESVSISFWA